MGTRLETYVARWLDYEPPSDCHDFGIGSLLIPVLTGLGIGADTAGIAAPILGGALTGSALGAGSTLITGGDPLLGALTGGLTGGATAGLGGPLGETLGIGATAGKALVGAGTGLIGSEITGGDPITGALTGGAGGLISGALGGSSATATATPSAATPPAGPAVGGSSAASVAAPALISAGGGGGGGGLAPVDITSGSAAGGAGGPIATAAPAASTGGTGTMDIFGNMDTPVGTPAAQTSSGVQYGDWSPMPKGGSTGGGGLGGTVSNLFGSLTSNPASLLGVAGLGATLLRGPGGPTGAEKQLQQQAGEAQTIGQTLQAYQISGTLPPGLQQMVDQQFHEAAAGVTSEFSKLGLGNSTMLADKLNQLKTQKAGEIAQFADNLAKQGIDWTKLSANEFQSLMQAQQVRETNFQNALSNFAMGLAGGGLRGTATSGAATTTTPAIAAA